MVLLHEGWRRAAASELEHSGSEDCALRSETTQKKPRSISPMKTIFEIVNDRRSEWRLSWFARMGAIQLSGSSPGSVPTGFEQGNSPRSTNLIPHGALVSQRVEATGGLATAKLQT